MTENPNYINMVSYIASHLVYNIMQRV